MVSSSNDNIYELYEKKFNVIYPDSTNATYSSLLNFSDEAGKPFQRWYRYKEGFSIALVKHLIKEYSTGKGMILDPFSGSGSTILAAAQLGYEGIGFEVNPFSYFLSKCKLDSYTTDELHEYESTYKYIIENAKVVKLEYDLPNLSVSHKVFNDNVEPYYMTVKQLISNASLKHEKVRNLLKLGWLACIEELSNYRKAGNGLKIRKYVKPRIITVDDAYYMLSNQYNIILRDLERTQLNISYKLYNCTSLLMNRYITPGTINGIIFSPPYANCFDYTEIYKLELWFGDFVKEYVDLKELRKESIRSHLNGNLEDIVVEKSDFLNNLIDKLDGIKLWDKKIPKMLNLYFNDMFKIIDESFTALEDKGFCCIVVGNSAYGGVVFPTDLILADYAKNVGFYVDKIEVDRFIITSSQQYEITKDIGKFLRESVLCLIKK